MSTVKFTNGGEIAVKNIVGGRKTVQGAQRDTLLFKLDPTAVDLNTAMEMFTEQPTITICSENSETGETEQFIYNDYTIMFEVSLKQELVSPETSESAAVYAQYINIGLAQKTYLEKCTEDNASRIGATEEAILALMDMQV